MNTFGSVAKVIEDFLEKMSAAGFTDGVFEEFVRQLPDARFGHVGEGLARMLYLAHLGLAKFELDPKVVVMCDYSKYGEVEGVSFSEGDRCYYKVMPEDLHLYDLRLNLTTLFLSSPFPRAGSVKSLTLESALTELKSVSSDRIAIGSFWHGEWLIKHQEFIPATWRKITESGGRIIFPKVRLVSVPTHDGEVELVLYPYIAHSLGSKYVMEYRHDMQVEYGYSKDPEKLIRGKDFFACYRVEDKKA